MSMDNDQLLNKVQEFLEGFERRTERRIESVRDDTAQLGRDLVAEIQRLTARVDVCTGLMEKLTPAFLSYMQDAGKETAEFRLRLSALESRVNRMELKASVVSASREGPRQ
jgi:Mg2+ and Co2+ transporter CorA